MRLAWGDTPLVRAGVRTGSNHTTKNESKTSTVITVRPVDGYPRRPAGAAHPFEEIEEAVLAGTGVHEGDVVETGILELIDHPKETNWPRMSSSRTLAAAASKFKGFSSSDMTFQPLNKAHALVVSAADTAACSVDAQASGASP